MKCMNRLWVGLGASVVVVALMAGVTLGITTLLGVTFEEGEPKPAEGLQTGSVGTDESGRPHDAQTGSEGINQPGPADSAQAGQYPGVSICVQAIGVDATVEAVAKARVETALLEVAQHPYWNVSGRGALPPLVDIGCPAEPLTARPGVQWIDAHYAGGDGILYRVPEAGFYTEYVFIMPLERIDELLGGLTIRVAPQEIVTEGSSVSAESASATYITPEELQDASFLVKHLTIAVGLEDRYVDPAPE
jgi:hypothetical protein